MESQLRVLGNEDPPVSVPAQTVSIPRQPQDTGEMPVLGEVVS
jgi:hypothetical protein